MQLQRKQRQQQAQTRSRRACSSSCTSVVTGNADVCGGTRCVLHFPAAAAGASARQPAARSLRLHSAGQAGQAPGASSDAAQSAAGDDDLIMHQSVSASGMMSVTLRPPQPYAVEDPDRRLLANQAFVRAKEARSRRNEAASSSSEDEETFIKGVVQRAVAAGCVKPEAAEAVEAVLAGRDPISNGLQPTAQESDAEPALPPRKHEAVRRITVDFLEQKGYFDRPIQASCGYSMTGLAKQLLHNARTSILRNVQ